jgi:proteasome accessory factor B
VNRTERLLDLITYLLNATEPVSWQEIKNHFPDDYARGVEESNQRKFERDKAELISLGIPIDYKTGNDLKKEGYIIEKERLFLPEVEFSPKESSLLMLSAGAVLENETFPYRDQLESCLHKITSIQDPIQSAPPELSITYTSEDNSARAPWIHEIQDALERRKWIEIVYHAFTTGETKERRVDPYGLVFRRTNWTVIGWDHLRHDLRSFVLTRIQSLKVNPKRPGTADYEIPKRFSLKKYRDQQTWEFDYHSSIPVTIEVTQHRLPELLPQLRNAERVSPRVFRLNVTNRSGLLSWLLSQKTDVRVLEPAEIQAEILEAVRGLL